VQKQDSQEGRGGKGEGGSTFLRVSLGVGKMRMKKVKKKDNGGGGAPFLEFPSLAVLATEEIEEVLEELGSVGGNARGVPKKDNRFNSVKKGEMRVSCTVFASCITNWSALIVLHKA
jgi:hypothetical protein